MDPPTKFVFVEAVELVEIVEVDLVVVEPLAPITATSSGQGGNQQLPKSGEVQVSFQSQATGKFWTPLNDIVICVPLTSNLKERTSLLIKAKITSNKLHIDETVSNHGNATDHITSRT